MKVVVSGGLGFIGSHLVDALVTAGNEVHVIDLEEPRRNQSRFNPSAIYHQVDVRDEEWVERIMIRTDQVFHLAAAARVQYSIDFPKESSDVNVNGMLTLLEGARKAKVRRFVYSASSAAYGAQDETVLSEDMAAHPMSPYAAQKLYGEILCETWTRTYGLPTVSLRYFNVYGPRLDPDGPYALLMGVFLRKSGEPLTITGDGSQTRDFIHVSDVVRANLLAATSEVVGNGEVINIGSGVSVSVNEVACMFGGPVKYIPERLEPHDTCASIQRAKDLLGWNPTVELKHGVQVLLEANN